MLFIYIHTYTYHTYLYTSCFSVMQKDISISNNKLFLIYKTLCNSIRKVQTKYQKNRQRIGIGKSQKNANYQ